MALDVPRVENSSDQIDLTLCWLEPCGLREEALRARLHSCLRKSNRCVRWTVGFELPLTGDVERNGVP